MNISEFHPEAAAHMEQSFHETLTKTSAEVHALHIFLSIVTKFLYCPLLFFFFIGIHSMQD